MGDVAVAVVGSGPDVAALADALTDAVPGVRLPHPAGPDLPDDTSGLAGVVVGADALARGVAAAALDAGLPVLCAPPTTDATAARALLDAERAAGGPSVRAGFPRRHDPRLRELRLLADEGELGDLRLVRGVETCADADTGLLHALDTVAWLTGRPVADLRVEDGNDVRLVTVRTAGGPVADLELRLAPHDPAGSRWEVLGAGGSAEVVVTAAHLAEAQRILLTAWTRSLTSPARAGASADDAWAAAAALGAAVAPVPRS